MLAFSKGSHGSLLLHRVGAEYSDRILTGRVSHSPQVSACAGLSQSWPCTRALQPHSLAPRSTSFGRRGLGCGKFLRWCFYGAQAACRLCSTRVWAASSTLALAAKYQWQLIPQLRQANAHALGCGWGSGINHTTQAQACAVLVSPLSSFLKYRWGGFPHLWRSRQALPAFAVQGTLDVIVMFQVGRHGRSLRGRLRMASLADHFSRTAGRGSATAASRAYAAGSLRLLWLDAGRPTCKALHGNKETAGSALESGYLYLQAHTPAFADTICGTAARRWCGRCVVAGDWPGCPSGVGGRSRTSSCWRTSPAQRSCLSGGGCHTGLEADRLATPVLWCTTSGAQLPLQVRSV